MSSAHFFSDGPLNHWTCADERFGTCERADLYRETQKALKAIRLTELGARAGLVRQLTGLDKNVTKRLYRQLQGKPSPPGLSPFSDVWYLNNTRRLLHASMVWKLYQHLGNGERDDASVLINVYEGYLSLVNEPLLSLTRAFFVPRLVANKVWHEQVCGHCSTRYVAPLSHGKDTCPGCERYYRHRCRRCGVAMKVCEKGRRRKLCDECRSGKN